MQTVLADLHVHTLLSPCAEVEMTPHHIVMRAAEYGIGAVAITDHNASANVPAALEAAQRYGVKVFPGMEVESSEEAHIVALFDTLEQLQSWQLLVDEHMNGMLNDVERFGVFRELKRLHDDHAARFTVEVLFQRTAVDHDLASAALDENTSDRALAAAGAVVVVTDHLSSLSEIRGQEPWVAGRSAGVRRRRRS